MSFAVRGYAPRKILFEPEKRNTLESTGRNLISNYDACCLKRGFKTPEENFFTLYAELGER